VAGALVLYPVVDHYAAGFPSYVERARGQTLTSDFMHFFLDTYLAGTSADRAGEKAFPLHSTALDTLPPTLLITAEFDPLRDEGRAMADKLQEAGVPLHFRHFETAAHGFACSEGPNDNYLALMADVESWLAEL
jgi:acetyl esterase